MAVQTETPDLRDQAELLAGIHRQSDPEIQRVLWFADPSGKEVRLIDLSGDCPRSVGPREHLSPFYFQPVPRDGLTAAMAIVVIHPDDVDSMDPPEGWGEWREATDL